MNDKDWPFAVVTQNVTGLGRVQRVVRVLINRSAWFVVTPLPDDVWAITMKAGDAIDVRAYEIRNWV